MTTQRWARVAAVALLLVLSVQACASTPDVMVRGASSPGIDDTHGNAIQSVALAPVNGKIAVVDGLAGARPTVKVTLPNGTDFTMSEAKPMVGIRTWDWDGHLVIAGTDCPGFDPSTAVRAAEDDCGTTDVSVLTFDLQRHTFETVASHVAGEWPAGPVSTGRLLLDGGRAELDLRTGSISKTDPYPQVGALPCPVGSDLLVASVDQGDLQQPDEPIDWTAKAFFRSHTDSSWKALDATDLDTLLEGASAAGIAGCSPDGPLLWRYKEHQIAVFSIEVNGDEIIATPFGAAASSDAPPVPSMDGSGQWLALSPLVPEQNDTHRAQVSAGNGWRTFDWQGEPLRTGKWAVDGDTIVYADRYAGGSWQLKQADLT